MVSLLATHSANDSLKNILRSDNIAELLRRNLDSPEARSLLGAKLVDFALNGIKPASNQTAKRQRRTWKQRIEALLPIFAKNMFRDVFVKPHVDNYILAFRVFIILRMHKMLLSTGKGSPKQPVRPDIGNAV